MACWFTAKAHFGDTLAVDGMQDTPAMPVSGLIFPRETLYHKPQLEESFRPDIGAERPFDGALKPLASLEPVRQHKQKIVTVRLTLPLSSNTGTGLLDGFDDAF